MSSQVLSSDFSALLHEHRCELDALDAQLVSLLAARFSVTRRVGALKAAHGAAAADPTREKEQLERLLALSGELDLPTEVTRAVYETLFRFVRANHLAQAAATNAGAERERAE
jgi:chorismate mutase